MEDSLEEGQIYACHHGDYAGQMFAFIEEKELSYNFIRLPDMINISVTTEDFSEGIEAEILQFVKDLPDDVYKVVKAQYKKNEDTNN